MRKLLNTILFLFLIINLGFISSCSSTGKVQNVLLTDTTSTLIPSTGIFVNLLEQVRQTYIEALKYQEKGEELNAIRSYEKAVDLLNDLSYYPDTDSISDFIELEKSVIEDYQKYVDNIQELPADVPLIALKEWLERKIPLSTNFTKKGLINSGDLPLEINEYVENYINFFTGRGKNAIKNWMARSGRYFPMMRTIFKENGLPEGLVYLSAIESGLNPRAVSRAKAVGLWQFIKSTGSLYNLSGNYFYDERRDPEKATTAAARHLKDLYNSLGNWYLALAAYNCGEARVKKAISKSSSNNYWDILDKLPRETRGYVPTFIAASIIMQNPEKFGFQDVEYDRPIPYDVYNISGCYELSSIASAANTTFELVQELNPELLQYVTPPTTQSGIYQLKIPKGTIDNLAMNFSKLPPAPHKTYIVHKVKRGETLSKIASQYGVDEKTIADANNIPTKIKLKRNSSLRVPIPLINNDLNFTYIENDPSNDESKENTTDVSEETDEGVDHEIAQVDDQNSNNNLSNTFTINTDGKKSINYKVKKGDSISKIAELFQIRITDLRIWNNLRYDKKISVGQLLTVFVPSDKYPLYANLDNNTITEKISVKNNPTTNQSKILYHTVKKGESLGSISRKYDIAVADIKQWNKIKSNTLRKGQRIKLYTTPEYISNLADNNQKTKTTQQSYTSNQGQYSVKKGETLSDIAQKFNVSISELREWNKLNKDNLKANQKIVVNNSYASNINTSKGDNNISKKRIYHKVKKGETLGEIADRYHLGVSELKKLNKIKSNIIKPGKKLLVSK